MTDDRFTLPVRPEQRHRQNEYQPRHSRPEPEKHVVPRPTPSPEGQPPQASGGSRFPPPYDRPGPDADGFPRPPEDTGDIK